MALDINRIRVLCFDVDGTLSDTDDKWVDKLNKVLHPVRGIFPGKSPHRFSRRVIMITDTPGNLGYTILDSLGLDAQVARLLGYMAKRKGKKKESFWLIPQTLEMLTELHKEYPLSIVSARGENSTRAFLDHYDLTRFFQVITCGQTVKYTKPFPDPILHTASQMNFEPHECLMIGDTTVDIKAGKRAGAQTVGVLCGFGSERELRRAGADLILKSPADLVSLLLNRELPA